MQVITGGSGSMSDNSCNGSEVTSNTCCWMPTGEC